MRRNLLKLVLVPVTIIVLLLVAAPALAASTDIMSDDCHSSPHPAKAPIPVCCATADCLLINCNITCFADTRALLTGRYFPNNSTGVIRSQTAEASGTAPDLIKPPQRDPASAFPFTLDTEHRCRNSLSSEEPSLV